MAYLLTQIIFCLVLAALCGGAVGWIINGWRASRREEALRVELLKQSLALNQAETDNSMIEDDFRELKYRSEEAVALLREETAQIPVLQQNLEQSQLLVRQMMQKHDGTIREMEHERDTLIARNRDLENRENAVTKLQAELNQQRLMMSSERVAREASEAASKLAASDTPQPGSPPDQQSLQHSNAVHEVHTGAYSTTQNGQSSTPRDPSASDQHDADSQDLSALTSSTEGASHQGSAQPDKASSGKSTLDTSMDFGVTDVDDDLQSIYGIGPVAAKTLKSLGVTSFEQIARFTRKDIEYIADVLGIFPGRIETDDWVGSARMRIDSQVERDNPNDEGDVPVGTTAALALDDD